MPESRQYQDDQKDVTSNKLVDLQAEILNLNPETENVLKNAEKIVNLFAGNANESKRLLEILTSVGNGQCAVVAVDKEQPFRQSFVDEISKQFPDRFAFVQADAFEFLSSRTPDSIDIVTAFGADYVLEADDQKLQDFQESVNRVLKPGGVVIVPMIELHTLVKKYGFKKITDLIYQKP